VLATILGFGVVALALSQFVTRATYRPLNEVESRSLTLRRPSSHQPPGAVPWVSDALDELISSLDSYKLSGYILDSMSGGIMTLSPEGTVSSFNSKAAQILGAEAADAMGRHYTEIFPHHPDNGRFLDMLGQAFYEQRMFSSEEVTVRLPNNDLLSLGVSVSALKDEGGRSMGLLVAFKDVAELNALRERVRRAQHLANLGLLAAGVAHEVRNPLASLRGLVELIEEDLPPADRKRQYTSTIIRSIDDLDHLVEEMLIFANPSELDVERCDVNDIVRAAMALACEPGMRTDVHVVEQYASLAPIVHADRERLGRACLNIIRNAIEATPPGGSISISTRSEACAGALGNSGGLAIISCRNSGSYIAPEDREKVFTPFYTTKKNGTGLGLAICHEIVRAHGGHISVASDRQMGTCFQIELPTPVAPALAPVGDRVQTPGSMPV